MSYYSRSDPNKGLEKRQSSADRASLAQTPASPPSNSDRRASATESTPAAASPEEALPNASTSAASLSKHMSLPPASTAPAQTASIDKHASVPAPRRDADDATQSGPPPSAEANAAASPSATGQAPSPRPSLSPLVPTSQSQGSSVRSSGNNRYSVANVHPSQAPVRSAFLQPPSAQVPHRPYSRSLAQWSNESRSSNSLSKGQNYPSQSSSLRQSSIIMDDGMSTADSTPGQKDLEWLRQGEDDNDDDDDGMHSMPQAGEKGLERSTFTLRSWRGLLNGLTMLIVICGLLTLFAGYPLISHFAEEKAGNLGAFGLGGTNGTGQVPLIQSSMRLIDGDTPQPAYKWNSGFDNEPYHLVFSDEFNVEGRSFWPGDDPFWEGVDIWYGATADFEWYTPEQINTTNGYLQFTMTDKPMHDLNFRSGMLQSWNKLCYQGGYIEFNVILPGAPTEVGFWPALWMQGNLARPGYLGTTDGMWPYSYQGCDSGILPNQTAPGREGYDLVSGYKDDQGLSYLRGMRLPSCTCSGEDHPGPNVNFARSAPELDVLEAQVKQLRNGVTSQSLQMAPFDLDYEWDKSGSTIFDPSSTSYNTYKGKVYQQSASCLANISRSAYVNGGNQWTRFGVEWRPDFEFDGSGSVTWYVDGSPTWQVTGAAFPARPEIDLSRRLIPSEPMSIVMNLGIARSFQRDMDFDTLNFPATFKVDYVRLYQPDSYPNNGDRLSCDPPSHPSSAYIERHKDVYYNRNLTTWPKAVPKNTITGC